MLSIYQQTAYQELIRLHRTRPNPRWEGSFSLKESGGKSYWRSSYRENGEKKSLFLGLDTPVIRGEIEEARSENEKLRLWKNNASVQVGLLRRDGFGADKQIGDVVQRLEEGGFFRAGGMICGTHAFRAYRLELGDELGGLDNVNTKDIDILMPEALAISGPLPLAQKILTDVIGAEPVHHPEHAGPFRWQKNGFEIEVLGKAGREGDAVRTHGLSKDFLMGLKFMEFLFPEPITAILPYRNGVPYTVPAPERYALHKLIVSTRRKGTRDQGKVRKDRAQAEALIRVLSEDRPEDLAKAWHDLTNRGKSWRKRAEQALSTMPDTKSVISVIAEEHGQADEFKNDNDL